MTSAQLPDRRGVPNGIESRRVTADDEVIGDTAGSDGAADVPADAALDASARHGVPNSANRVADRLAALSAALFDADREPRYERSIDTDHTSTGGYKVAAFDGLRGLACVLVLLGHSWIIVPADVIESVGVLRGLFRSPSLAVILFLVLGGFLVTRSLLDQQQRIGTIPVGRFWLRRLVRIGAQLVPFALIILVVSSVDRWDTYTGEQTRRSLVNILRFTFNWSLVNDPLGNREDLGHLWYLSVEQQVYVVLVLLLVWLAHYRLALIALLTAAAIAVMVHRWIVFDQDGWFVASLQTFTRADGLLLGAAAALSFPLLRRRADGLRHVALPALVACGFLVLLSAPLSNTAYLQLQGAIFVLAAAALVLGVAVAARPDGLAERFLSWAPFRFFGQISFPVYLWHFPVFFAADRWAHDLQWLPRALLTLVALAAIVTVTQLTIERPVGRWLDRNRNSNAPASQAVTSTATA